MPAYLPCSLMTSGINTDNRTCTISVSKPVGDCFAERCFLGGVCLKGVEDGGFRLAYYLFFYVWLFHILSFFL